MLTLHCCDEEQRRLCHRCSLTSTNSQLMTSSKSDLSALSDFTPKELRKLRSMKNPYGIQKFLDAMPYHLEDTAWSPRKVLAERSAHCLEGAIFAAAALRANGYPPLLLDFEAEQDTDHVIAIFRENGCWGAVAKSNYSGCRWREPIHRRHWMTTEKPVWFIVYHLFDIKHYSLITPAQAKRLHRVDERLFQAECLGKAYKTGPKP